MGIIEKIKSLREASYRQTVALLSRGNVSLQCGLFSTEEDFDRELDAFLSENAALTAKYGE